MLNSALQTANVYGLALCCIWGTSHSADLPPDEGQQAGQVTEEITVVGERDLGLITLTLSAEDVSGVPGIQDDPVRAITILPGVTSNSDVQSGIAIRGSGPADNSYYLDFLPVEYLFHLTGLSVVDADTTRRVALHPVAYPAPYQGAIGGVITVDSNDPARDGAHGLVDASLLHAGILLEGPINETQRGFASARASYYDVVIGSYIEERQEDEDEGKEIVQLPKYWDYRARYQLDLGEHSTLDLFADGASDDVELLFEDDAADVVLDPVLAGQHRFGIESHRQGAVFKHPQGDGRHLTAGVGFITTTIDASSGGRGDIESHSSQLVARVVQSLPLTGSQAFNLGAQYTQTDLDYDIVVRDNGCTEFDVDCRFSDDEFVTADRGRTSSEHSLFAEYTIHPSENARVSLGASYRYDDYSGTHHLEPRAHFEMNLNSAWSMFLAAGRYSQAPAFQFSEPALGNPALDDLEADHYIIGLQFGIPGLSVSLDTYYKEFDGLVTSNPSTRYDGRGEGDAWGLDLFARLTRDAWSLWFSFSYANSTRYDPDTGARFDYAYDQPIVTSLMAKYDFNERLSASARVSYHTGPPYTRILTGSPDPDRPGSFEPVYDEINDARYPNYFRMDLRADWFFSAKRDSKVYVELVNATNRENVFDYEYSRDYTMRKNVEQLPLFVSIGISKRW